MAEQKRDMALSDVLRQLEETHRLLIDYLQSVPEEHFTRETRFRHRLRLDTYSHYPLHARAIQEWRAGVRSGMCIVIQKSVPRLPGPATTTPICYYYLPFESP